MHLGKTLQEIDGEDWGDPGGAETPMVARCRSLRRLPLQQWTADDLRLMIGQQISLPVLVPLAFEMLDDTPALEAIHYPGDLLQALLRIDPKYWRDHQDYLRHLTATALVVETSYGVIVDACREFLKANNVEVSDL